MKRDWLPLPPPEYMLLVNGVGSVADRLAEIFTAAGEAVMRELKANDLLRAGERVLEIGCGCGRFARMLVDEPIASYVGFDLDPNMIEWCTKEITIRDPRFTFRLLDPASDRSPFEDDSFDFAMLESALTRMPLEHAAAYLRELGRVIAPGGRVVLSVFFAAGRSRVDAVFHFYEQKAFWRAVEEAGFHHQLREPPATGVVPNWCVLTPRSGG